MPVNWRGVFVALKAVKHNVEITQDRQQKGQLQAEAVGESALR